MSKLEELIKKLCPNGVEYRTLGTLGEFYGGLSGKNKNDFNNGNAKYITYMNIYKNIKVNKNDLEKVKINKGEKQNKVEYGDVLFTGSSENLEECGLSSVFADNIDDDIYLNSFCFGLKFYNREMFNPEFLKYLFRSHKLRKKIIKTASGVTRFNVSKKKMENVSIPVPPIEVQNEIVQILDNFTELEAKLEAELEAELEARKEQYSYYFYKLMNSNQYRKIKLSEIGKVKMCKRILKNQTTPEGDIPFYKIGTFGKKADSYISEETFKELKSKYSYPKKGDILISCSGTIGRTVVFDGKPAYFQDSNIVWLEHDETIITNSFLKYCYRMSPWRIATGGTIARLYNDNILNAEVLVPTLDEQERIVSILDRFDKICNDITEGIPAEIEARRKQYEYYRDKLLNFKELKVENKE